jgi:hypothetical protein
MTRRNVLISTGYGLALLLIILPLLQPLVSLLPIQPGEIRWRLQAFGAISGALLLPTVGMTLAIGTAAFLGHRRTVRTLAALAFGCAAAIGVVAALFVLDLLQYRAAVDVQLRDFYHVAGLVYLLGYGLCSIYLACLAAAAWRVSSRSRRRRTSRRAEVPAAASAPVVG